MYCPKCRGEFEDWVKTCPDCQVDLVAEPPPPPVQAAGFNPIRGLGQSLRNSRLMLTLAGATLFLALCALVSLSVGTATAEQAGAWEMAETIMYSLGHAVFYPGLLLGLAAMVVPPSSGRTADPRRVFRVLVIAAVAMVLLGVGQAVTIVHKWSGHYDQLGWNTAGEVSYQLVGQLFLGGVLLGLGYLCLRRAEAFESSQEIAQQPES